MQLLKQIPMQEMCGGHTWQCGGTPELRSVDLLGNQGLRKQRDTRRQYFQKERKVFSTMQYSCSNSVNNNTLMAIKTESFSYLCLQAPCFHHYTDTKFAFPQHLSCLNVLFFLLKENRLTVSVLE